MTFAEFIRAHDGDDPVRLLLSRDRYPDIDVELAASTLECRRRLRTKVPEWYAVPSLVYPNRLAAEQCSSTETARYKAAVAARAAGHGRIADLTGGLGVDSWAFAGVFDAVLYNEMQPALAEAAEGNFARLGVGNVRFNSREAHPGGVAGVLGDFAPEIIFLDPARRAEDGRKVFLLEDCRPDVLTLLPELFAAARYVLVKLSPMADISMCISRLGHVREVHAVAAEGECKELLLLLDREWTAPCRIIAYENGSSLSWTPDEEASAVVSLASAPSPGTPLLEPEKALFKPGALLFEPGKALLKAGAFRLLSARFGLEKLDVNTHLYVTEDVPPELAPLGKTFRILEVLPLNKRTMKEIGRRYPRAEVTARNIPMRSDELRKRLGCASGGDVHIFGVRCGKDLLCVVAAVDR